LHFFYEKYDASGDVEENMKESNSSFEIVVEDKDNISCYGRAAGAPAPDTFDKHPLTSPAYWEISINIHKIEKNNVSGNDLLLGTNEIMGTVYPIEPPRVPRDETYGTGCNAKVKDKKKGDTEEYTIYFTVGNQMGLLSIDPEIKINPNEV
jgi:hypothetical protein